MQAAGPFRLTVCPSPAKVWVPLLPTYASVAVTDWVSCLWTLRFHASTVGRSWGLSRIFALRPFGIGIWPLEGMTGKTNGMGPSVRLKAAVFAPELVRL